LPVRTWTRKRTRNCFSAPRPRPLPRPIESSTVYSIEAFLGHALVGQDGPNQGQQYTLTAVRVGLDQRVRYDLLCDAQRIAERVARLDDDVVLYLTC
jgi:hypothetical protein